MMSVLLDHYLWLKALHIISMVAWMAGLLYLPRLFVYHAENLGKPDLEETFKVMERRLYFYIMRPAMLATWAFGLLMLAANFESLMVSGWMHAKLTLVVLLTGIHHMFGAWRRKFERGENTKSARFYRIWNEMPTVVLIVVVVLAVLKPF